MSIRSRVRATRTLRGHLDNLPPDIPDGSLARKCVLFWGCFNSVQTDEDYDGLGWPALSLNVLKLIPSYSQGVMIKAWRLWPASLEPSFFLSAS